MVKLLFFHFRVSNSNLKNIKLYFELYEPKPGWYWKFNYTSVLYHLRLIKTKVVYVSGHPLNEIMFTMYHNQLLFSFVF